MALKGLMSVAKKVANWLVG